MTGATPQQVSAAATQHRLVDIDTRDGKTFSYVWVEKGHGIASPSFTPDASFVKAQSDVAAKTTDTVAIARFENGASHRYAYLLAPTVGSAAERLAKDAGAATLSAAAKDGYRPLDVATDAAGSNALLVHTSKPVANLVLSGYSVDDLGIRSREQAMRPFKIASSGTVSNQRYTSVLVDNATAEEARIRGIGDAEWGANSNWGAYVEPVGGAATVNLGGDDPYQPASVQKIVAALTALRMIDRGEHPQGFTSWADDTQIPYTAKPGSIDEPACPGTAAGETGSLPLAVPAAGQDILHTVIGQMLQRSQGRSLESLLDVLLEGNPDRFNDEMDQAGFPHTTMTYGCPQHVGDPEPYVDGNRTTLREISGIWAGIWDGSLLSDAQRAILLGLTGKVLPDFDAVVDDEAAKLGLPASTASAFLSQTVYYGKNGGLNKPVADGNIHTTGDAGVLVIPTHNGAGHAAYAGAFHLDDLHTPCLPPDYAVDNSSSCARFWHGMDTTFQRMEAERFRPAVRAALTTWTAVRR